MAPSQDFFSPYGWTAHLTTRFFSTDRQPCFLLLVYQLFKYLSFIYLLFVYFLFLCLLLVYLLCRGQESMPQTAEPPPAQCSGE